MGHMRQTRQIERLGQIEHIDQMGQPERIQHIEEQTIQNEYNKWD